MASLRERLVARQEEKARQGAVAGGSLRERIAARQAQRAQPQSQEDPRGLVSPGAASSQVQEAAGGAPIFHMDTSGQAFINGKPASTMDIVKGMFSGDYQLPPEPEPRLEVGRQPGPLETMDPLAQRFIQANRGFGEEHTIAGAPSRAVDFLAHTPEGNRAALEMAGGMVAAPLGPAALPATAARLSPLVTRAMTGGAGAGVGSLVGSATVAPNERPLGRARDAILEAGGGEGVGGKVAEKALGGIARLRSGGFPAVPGAARTFEQLQRQGVTIPAGNLSKSRMIDIPQKMSESAVIGGKKLQEAAEASEAAALKDLDEFVKRFSVEGGIESVGEAGQKSLDDAFQAGRAANTQRYASVDEISEGVGVDFTDVLTRADEIAADAALTPGMRGKANTLGNSIRQVVQPEEVVGTGIFDEAGEEILRTIPANNIVPWEQAAAFRSMALRIGRDPTEFIAGDAQAAGKRLSPVIGDVMDEAMARLGAKALAVAKRASAKYKAFSEIYTNQTIELLAKRDPDQFYKTAIRSQSPTAIRRARHAIDDPDVWRQMQGQFMLERINKSVAGEMARAQGKAIGKSTRAFGREALEELFPNPRDLRKFEELVTALEHSQQGAGKGLPGGIFIQMQQSQAVLISAMGAVGAASGKALAGAGGILIGPMMAGRVLTNQKFVRWAIVGMKAKPGSPAAARAFSQMMLIYNREKTIHDKRLKKQRQQIEQRGAAGNTAIP